VPTTSIPACRTQRIPHLTRGRVHSVVEGTLAVGEVILAGAEVILAGAEGMEAEVAMDKVGGGRS